MANTLNWNRAQALIEAQHRVKMQAMSQQESLQAFFSLMTFALSRRDDSEGWNRMLDAKWEQKLVARTKLVATMRKTGALTFQ